MNTHGSTREKRNPHWNEEWSKIRVSPAAQTPLFTFGHGPILFPECDVLRSRTSMRPPLADQQMIASRHLPTSRICGRSREGRGGPRTRGPQSPVALLLPSQSKPPNKRELKDNLRTQGSLDSLLCGFCGGEKVVGTEAAPNKSEGGPQGDPGSSVAARTPPRCPPYSVTRLGGFLGGGFLARSVGRREPWREPMGRGRPPGILGDMWLEDFWLFWGPLC